MKDTSLVSVISLMEVVQVGTDIQSKTFNSSALTLGAIMFLVVTIPLARIVDWLIAREHAKTQRGAPTDADGGVPLDALATPGAGGMGAGL
jgi:polar amino acid transport system permease protein